MGRYAPDVTWYDSLDCIDGGARLALIRWINGRTTTAVPPYTSAPPAGPSALEMLRQRYARGEIDTATFEQMRERLESSSPPGYQRSDGNQPTIDGR